MAKSIALDAPVQEGPKTQPNYQWSPDEKFEINGRTLEISMSVLGAILSEPESQKVLALAELYKMYQAVFAQGVKDGTIVDKNQKVEADS